MNYLKILLFFSLLLFLSFNKHSKDKEKSYHDVIWADAAGYYVYNPVWFIYGNDAQFFPDSISNNIGNGFYKDSVSNKIVTKYYSGTALLQAPFFIAAHLLAKPFGFEATGFSKIYSYALYVCGVFYFFTGILLLFSFLKNHFSFIVSLLATISFFVCTNLYYYTIDAPGMSHIYSFFVFSCIVYISPKLIQKEKIAYFILFFLLISLAVLIRPTNIIVALFPFFYAVKSKSDFFNRLNYFSGKIKWVAFALFLSILLWLPQLFYWKSISGNFLSYSYKNEGFDFLTNPRLLEVWFSTNNGLFVYSPLVILALAGIVVMLKKGEKLGFYLGILFLFISYLFASWWNWWFGCALGARSFVEYYALFVFPFAYLLHSAKKNKFLFICLLFFIGFCGFLNMSIEYYYDGCFYGETWDWSAFLKLI